MAQLTNSQLDSLLNFSRLHLLVFTPEWQLSGLHPNHRSFLGWDDADFGSFKFENNFLKPNFLDLPKFLGHFQQNNSVIRNYYWRNAENQVSGPFETYFRITRENGHIKMILAFIRIHQGSKKIEILPREKNKLFLAESLPGLLHNIFGPLGALTGRLEMLKQKNPQSLQYDELLRLTQVVQRSLKSLGHKISQERQLDLSEVDINSFLREELQYLQSDQFFKHQIKKNIKLDPQVRAVESHYASLSGILNEIYYFFRKFLFDDQEYSLQAETFFEGEGTGFYLNFIGDFQLPADLTIRFPFDLEGSANQVAQQKIDGLDCRYLSFCLRQINGYIEITGRKDMMKMRLILSA